MRLAVASRAWLERLLLRLGPDTKLLDATDPAAVYNVGSGTQTSLRTLVELARRTLGVAAEPVWGTMQDRSWDTTVWFADPRKIAAELGWRPAHTLEDGFRRTVDWLRADDSMARLYADRLARSPGQP